MLLQTTIWNYYIVYDSTQESSSEAFLRISNILSKWEDNLTNQRLDDAGLDNEVVLNPLRPISSTQGDIATAGEQAGFIFSFIIPLFATIRLISNLILSNTVLLIPTNISGYNSGYK